MCIHYDSIDLLDGRITLAENTTLGHKPATRRDQSIAATPEVSAGPAEATNRRGRSESAGANAARQGPTCPSRRAVRPRPRRHEPGSRARSTAKGNLAPPTGAAALRLFAAERAAASHAPRRPGRIVGSSTAKRGALCVSEFCLRPIDWAHRSRTLHIPDVCAADVILPLRANIENGCIESDVHE